VEHNLDEVVFQTIKSDATRVAALLRADIDMMTRCRCRTSRRVKVQPQCDGAHGTGAEDPFLNLDSFRDELLYSSVKGKNPVKDMRVSQGRDQAIDMERSTTSGARADSL